jgi:hydrogenase maturation protease
MRIALIGIGTPHGDDAVGPLVVDALAAEGLPAGVHALSWCRPPELVDALADADAALLVDATRAGLEPGTVHEPAAQDLLEARPLSSHGLGAREALALAEALGRAPQHLAIVGIEAGETSHDALSAPVREAIATASARVRARLAEWIAPGEEARHA